MSHEQTNYLYEAAFQPHPVTGQSRTLVSRDLPHSIGAPYQPGKRLSPTVGSIPDLLMGVHTRLALHTRFG